MLIGAVPDMLDLPDLGEEERPGHVVRALRGHLAAGCVEERARERERERSRLALECCVIFACFRRETFSLTC